MSKETSNTKIILAHMSPMSEIADKKSLLYCSKYIVRYNYIVYRECFFL